MPLPPPKLKKKDGGDDDDDGDIDNTFSDEVDVEAPSLVSDTGKNKNKNAEKKDKKADKSSFPTPRHVVSIYCPIVHVITQDIDPESGSVLPSSPANTYVGGPWKGFTSALPSDTSSSTGGQPLKSPTRKKIRRIKVKMGSMIIKMLNRLVRENVVGYDRVYISRTETHILVRMLASDRAVPILLMRCERIGVGSVVGSVFGCGLEWNMVPNITEEMQTKAATENPFDLATVTRYGSVDTTLVGGGNKEVAIDKEVGINKNGEAEGDEDEDAEEVSISSEDDDEDEEEEAASRKRHGKTKVSRQSVSSDAAGGEDVLTSAHKKKLAQQIANARQEWLLTGSRLRVLQVLESVKEGASLSFDYLWYVILAAWVAAMGLMGDSVAVVVASMLLSPLMGPCLGSTLGFTLRQKKLVLLGLRNEAISLLVCVFVGLLVAAIAVPVDGFAVRAWPSSEMVSRGSASGLVLGMFIAIPSGMGVALSVLGRNSGGLTGVAISLSLLPPAVNAGMCWMTALLYRTGAAARNEGDGTDYAFVGAISLCLTLLNIVCIFIGGCIMFALKEVVPVKDKNTFWSRDVKIAKRGFRKERLAPNAQAIKLGIKAALELEEALAKEGELHTNNDITLYDDKVRVAEAKRRGLAANAVEDALYVGGGRAFDRMDTNIIPGGAVSDDLIPDEDTYLDSESVDSDKASLLGVAEKAGGLEDAGELLFSSFADTATGLASRTNVWDDRLGDYGIDHEDVAGAVLLS